MRKQRQRNALKRLIEESLNLSLENHHYDWYYYFMEKNLDLCQDSWEAFQTFARESITLALKKGHISQAFIFYNLSIQRAISLSKWSHVQESLEQIAILLKENQGQTYAQKMFCMYKIIHLVHEGQTKLAIPLVSALHALLDQNHIPPDQDELTLPTSINPPQLSDLSISQRFAEVTCPYLVGYYVSGLVHKSHDPEKAFLFFSEGLKSVSTELEQLELESKKPCNLKDRFVDASLDIHISHIPFLIQLSTFISLSLVDIYLIRGDFTLATQVLISATETLLKHPRIFSEMEHQVLSYWAVLYQSLGLVQEATAIYTKLVARGDSQIALTAQLNLYFLSMSKKVLRFCLR
jgi:hypothetical protein